MITASDSSSTPLIFPAGTREFAQISRRAVSERRFAGFVGRLVLDNSVATTVLRLAKGAVGALDDFRERFAVERLGDTEAGRDRDGVAADRCEGEVRADTVDGFDRQRGVAVGQNHEELLTAPPAS